MNVQLEDVGMNVQEVDVGAHKLPDEEERSPAVTPAPLLSRFLEYVLPLRFISNDVIFRSNRLFFDSGGSTDDKAGDEIRNTKIEFFLLRKRKVKLKIDSIQKQLKIHDELKLIDNDKEAEEVRLKIEDMLDNVRNYDLPDMYNAQQQLLNTSHSGFLNPEREREVREGNDVRNRDLQTIGKILNNLNKQCKNEMVLEVSRGWSANNNNTHGEQEDEMVYLDTEDAEQKYMELMKKQDEAANKLAEKLEQMGELNKALQQQLITSTEQARDLEKTLIDLNEDAALADKKIASAAGVSNMKLKALVGAIVALALLGVTLVLGIVVLATVGPLVMQ